VPFSGSAVCLPAWLPSGLVESIAEVCPTAFINIISNPVNSLVPMAKEILTAAGVYDPKKLTGVTTLDIVRANTFVSQMKGTKASETYVPVIGGHSGLTILPLLSQTTPAVAFTDEEVDALSERIRDVSGANRPIHPATPFLPSFLPHRAGALTATSPSPAIPSACRSFIHRMHTCHAGGH